MDWHKKTILLVGGTGSFGQKFVEVMLQKYKPETLRVFSRDELKQWEMQKKFSGAKNVRFFIGDVRDKNRLERAMDGVDIVVLAAALKQVPSCEYNPFEAIKTNILGAQNIIEAAIDHNIERVLAISTDKAVNPVNLYGATKMCMEKIVIAANSYVGKRRTRLSCVRYGNVVGSRGSVVPVFKEQKKSGVITITDKKMTRFWITIDEGVKLVADSLEMMQGGEVIVPKIPSMLITELAKTIAPDCKVTYTGIRPGEKLHECLLTKDEARHALEFEKYFLIEPEFNWWNRKYLDGGKKLPADFQYTSDKNDQWLTSAELLSMIEDK